MKNSTSKFSTSKKIQRRKKYSRKLSTLKNSSSKIFNAEKIHNRKFSTLKNSSSKIFNVEKFIIEKFQRSENSSSKSFNFEKLPWTPSRSYTNFFPSRKIFLQVFFLIARRTLTNSYSRPFLPYLGVFFTSRPVVLGTLDLASFRTIGAADLAIFTAPLAGVELGKFTGLARRTKQGRTLVRSGPSHS